MVENRKKCYKCLIIIRNRNKQPFIEHLYENKTMIKTERTLIIGRSGCGKIFMTLSLSKDKNPHDVYIICKTDNQYPSEYHNHPSDIIPLEDSGNKTIVYNDMLRSKQAKDIYAFLTHGRHQNLDIF